MKRGMIAWAVVLGAALLAALALAAAPPGQTQVRPRATPALDLYLPLMEVGPRLTPTQTPGATSGPPVPTVTGTPPGLPGWLAYLNAMRALGELPPLTENASWSDGGWLHARYMVKNDWIGHYEDPGNPWYTVEGDQAARNGNALLSSSMGTSDEQAIDGWLTGPFHAVGLLDPQLLQTGYGSYREAIGSWHMGATLDVNRGLGSLPPGIVFPIRWPGQQAAVPLSTYWGGEYPDPLAGCPGYSAPSGLPIILQLGSGSLTPAVTAHSLMLGGTPLEHCVYDETTYTNPDPTEQSIGRGSLGARDAVVLIPRQPLTPGASYTVSITADGETHSWSLTVSGSAAGAGGPGMQMR